ncbi:Myb DNA-bind 5 domain-containing protein, partial [Aphis craccivora]
VQMYKTGGESNNSIISKTTDKIIGLLGDRMDPLFNSIDSDANYNDARFEVVDIFSEDISNLQDS